jgi:hypothetical protein
VAVIVIGMGDEAMVFVIALDRDVQFAYIPEFQVFVVSGHEVILFVRIIVN